MNGQPEQNFKQWIQCVNRIFTFFSLPKCCVHPYRTVLLRHLNQFGVTVCAEAHMRFASILEYRGENKKLSRYISTCINFIRYLLLISEKYIFLTQYEHKSLLCRFFRWLFFFLSLSLLVLLPGVLSTLTVKSCARSIVCASALDPSLMLPDLLSGFCGILHTRSSRFEEGGIPIHSKLYSILYVFHRSRF